MISDLRSRGEESREEKRIEGSASDVVGEMGGCAVVGGLLETLGLEDSRIEV